MRTFINTFGPKRAQSRGIAVLLSTLMVLGVMSVVGLAVDVGMMYGVQVKLSAAADAAALATARSLGRGGGSGPTVADISTAYFNANMPNGWLFASTAVPSTSVDTSVANIRTVRVSAQATVPTIFLRLLTNTQTIRVSAAASRRDVNLVLVLDKSGSMGSGAGSSCEQMKAAAQNFLLSFTPGRDNLALVVFGLSYYIGYPLPATGVQDYTVAVGGVTLNAALGAINCNGNTGSAQGLTQAKLMLDTLHQPGAINAIVFFTDGQPNGLTADWPIATAVTPSYSNSTGSNAGSVGTSVTQPFFTGYPASGCTSGYFTVGGVRLITGGIARNNEHQHGILAAQSQNNTNHDDGLRVTGSGCAFNNSTANAGDYSFANDDRVHEDVAYIPSTDTYGNSTDGYWTTATGAAIRFILTGPYTGKPLLDHYSPGTCGGGACGLYDNNIDLASMNAAESAASRARQATVITPTGGTAETNTVPIIVFCIGLGGATDAAPDQFLQHVANTPQSDLFDRTQPSGNYIYVTGAGQLGTAFNAIASFVLRLSS
jgi:Flp pilus assembly protein TadG